MGKSLGQLVVIVLQSAWAHGTNTSKEVSGLTGGRVVPPSQEDPKSRSEQHLANRPLSRQLGDSAKAVHY